jgi:RNA polymerase sigma-B factor
MVACEFIAVDDTDSASGARPMVGLTSDSLIGGEPVWPATAAAEPPFMLVDVVAEPAGEISGHLSSRSEHFAGEAEGVRAAVLSSAYGRFREFRLSRDAKLRTQLILDHHGLALSISRRFTWPGLSADDIIQIARIGLIHAVDRYDPERGVTFATFATHTIVGEIKRYLRDHGWPVKVPRHLRELHLQVRRAEDSLRLRLQRVPTIPEIARHLGIREETVTETMELARAAQLISLETPMPREDSAETIRLGDHLGMLDESLMDIETRLSVRASVDALEEHQRQIVFLRYFQGLTQSEVARRLSLSQMHISRLERRALARLRQLLADMHPTAVGST